MNSDLYFQIRSRHRHQHILNLGTRGHLPFDKSCYLCHPPSENPSNQFKRFYQWICQRYKVHSHSSLSERYFAELNQCYNINHPENLDTNKATKLAISLVFSLGFANFFNLEVIYQHILITLYNTNHFQLPPENTTNMSLTNEQFTNFVNQLTTTMTNGFNAINIPVPPAAGSSIVKIDPYYGKDNEDAQE